MDVSPKTKYFPSLFFFLRSKNVNSFYIHCTYFPIWFSIHSSTLHSAVQMSKQKKYLQHISESVFAVRNAQYSQDLTSAHAFLRGAQLENLTLKKENLCPSCFHWNVQRQKCLKYKQMNLNLQFNTTETRYLSFFCFTLKAVFITFHLADIWVCRLFKRRLHREHIFSKAEQWKQEPSHQWVELPKSTQIKVASLQ